MGSGQSNAEFVRSLLSNAPSPLRPTTLLDAMGMVRDEVPQSLFLAWLLGSQGPLSEHWLLRAIWEDVKSPAAWPGVPVRVAPEASLESERPDIVIDWPEFRLIIEYKIDSSEGADQVKRYLKTFGVLSPSSGLAIYLTPCGRWPRSVEPDDERVRAVSFAQIIRLIDHGLAHGSEPTERGRVFAAEYRNCLLRVLKRNLTMTKPIVSDATKILSSDHERLQRLLDAAKLETAEFIHYTAHRAEAALKPILGTDIVLEYLESWGYFTFRKPHWKTSKLYFGIAYGAEGRVGTRLMHEYNHCVAIRIYPFQRSSAKGQRAFAEALDDAIAKHISSEPYRNQYFAYCEEVSISQYPDWDAWSDVMISRLTACARDLAPVIDRFALKYAGKK